MSPNAYAYFSKYIYFLFSISLYNISKTQINPGQTGLKVNDVCGALSELVCVGLPASYEGR